MVDSKTEDCLKELGLTLEPSKWKPFEVVETPPGCRKRASVACIVRYRPTNDSEADAGVPEILFIKRAARAGDRFSAHVAFPGGHHDKKVDEDDKATAIRETLEEVGLDLNAEATYLGGLPQRVITTGWGRTPLMVLCPFVFVLKRFDIPPLVLQVSEVSSALWVPVESLLDLANHTKERSSVVGKPSRGRLVQHLFQLLAGSMQYPAVFLRPSEVINAAPSDIKPTDHPPESDKPPVLWGLTHGMVFDFLGRLPSVDLNKLWSWPTFSMPDTRFAIWLLTFQLRRRNMRNVKSNAPVSAAIIDEGIGISNSRAITAKNSSEVGHLLEGYFLRIEWAIVLSVLARTGFTFYWAVRLGKWVINRQKRSLS